MHSLKRFLLRFGEDAAHTRFRGMRRIGIFAAGGNGELCLFRHDNDVRIRGNHGGGADAGTQDKGNLRNNTGESGCCPSESRRKQRGDRRPRLRRPPMES